MLYVCLMSREKNFLICIQHTQLSIKCLDRVPKSTDEAASLSYFANLMFVCLVLCVVLEIQWRRRFFNNWTHPLSSPFTEPCAVHLKGPAAQHRARSSTVTNVATTMAAVIQAIVMAECRSVHLRLISPTKRFATRNSSATWEWVSISVRKMQLHYRVCVSITRFTEQIHPT